MMKHLIKIYVTSLSNIWMILIGASSLLLVTNCKTCTDSPANEPPQDLVSRTGAEELVLFCGNPGVGKSSLCNTIFQKAIFRSGVHPTGLTQSHQEYLFDKKSYIDTPGLADLARQKEAAQEIEAALKKDGNYKIIFVATFESGRMRTQDIVTINKVCETVRQPFDYGLIINKMTPRAVELAAQNMAIYTQFLHKKPALTYTIKREDNVDDAENTFITNAAIRAGLINFIANLQANIIRKEDVKPIDVTDYAAKAEELQKSLNEALLAKQAADEVLAKQAATDAAAASDEVGRSF